MDKIGFGTWRVEPNQAKEVILEAFSAGYTHFDLAYLYGNEREIGEAFKEYFTTHDRSKYWITTKLWNTNHKPENVIKQLNEQLAYLHLKYVDLFIIHWPIASQHGDNFIPLDNDGRGITEKGYGMRETWRAMESLVKDGKAKYIGVSNFCVAQLLDLLNYSEIKPYCNQIEVNVEFQNTTLVKYCLSQNVRVVAYRPLGGPQLGNLTDNGVLGKIAATHGKTVPEIILRWHFQKYGDSDLYHVIPKSQNPDRMRANLKIVHDKEFRLTDDEVQQINSLDRGSVARICISKYGVPVFD